MTAPVEPLKLLTIFGAEIFPLNVAPRPTKPLAESMTTELPVPTENPPTELYGWIDMGYIVRLFD